MQGQVSTTNEQMTLEKPSISGIKRKLKFDVTIPKKRAKVLMPLPSNNIPSSHENKIFRNNSIRNVVVRFFSCHICHLRKFLTSDEASICMMCKNHICSSCRGQIETDAFYICEKCLRE